MATKKKTPTKAKTGAASHLTGAQRQKLLAAVAKRVQTGKPTQRDLAANFGVSLTTICYHERKLKEHGARPIAPAEAAPDCSDGPAMLVPPTVESAPPSVLMGPGFRAWLNDGTEKGYFKLLKDNLPFFASAAKLLEYLK